MRERFLFAVWAKSLLRGRRAAGILPEQGVCSSAVLPCARRGPGQTWSKSGERINISLLDLSTKLLLVFC